MIKRFRNVDVHSNSRASKHSRYAVSILVFVIGALMMSESVTSVMANPARASAQGIITETVKRRNLVIDLGDGLKTDAQLTFPAIGDGPFPGVLLIHGSGNIDMDGYLSPETSGTEEGSKILFQIAEYLSERGFAVLRYNKRGIGLKGTFLDSDVFYNLTVHDLISDASKALEVLMRQSEVDTSDITIIGHSEGTFIAPRIAISDPRVKNIVLMGACAQKIIPDILYFQLVDKPIFYAEEIDSNHDGLLSIQEVYATLEVELVEYSPLPPYAVIENSTGEWLWYPGADLDKDGYFSIHEELKVLLQMSFEYPTTAEFPGSKWIQSHIASDTNLAIIGNVSASILILQGEGETQCPVEQAFLLEQRLTEIEHVDHTLITYPGLGHSFYPVDGWIQPLGPIRDYVLSDLVTWLKNPARKVRYLTAQIEGLNTELNLKTSELESAKTEIAELEGQVKDLQSESSSLQNTMTELERRERELQSALDLSKNIAYIAIGIAIIAVVVAAMTLRKR